MNKYVNRLTNEWREHGKIIIAVDYDDTIRNWKLEDYEMYDAVLETLRTAQETGAYIVVFTACKEDRYEEIRHYCKMHHINIDSINVNPIELPYGNQTKIYANIFLDDRAGINEALTTLQQAMYIIRGERAKQDAITQQF